MPGARPLQYAALAWAGLGVCRAQYINFNPIPFLGGSDGTKVTSKWWFWMIIGIVAAFMVVTAFFTVRGFMMWRRYKKRVAELEEMEKADVELGPMPPAGPEIFAEKVELDGSEAPRQVSVEKVEVTDDLERRTTGRGRHLAHTTSARF